MVEIEKAAYIVMAFLFMACSQESNCPAEKDDIAFMTISKKAGYEQLVDAALKKNSDSLLELVLLDVEHGSDEFNEHSQVIYFLLQKTDEDFFENAARVLHPNQRMLIVSYLGVGDIGCAQEFHSLEINERYPRLYKTLLSHE